MALPHAFAIRLSPSAYLVSAPLIAASKANEAILKQQTQFILDTCFTLEEDIQTPVMVKLRLSKTGIDFTKSNDELLVSGQKRA